MSKPENWPLQSFDAKDWAEAFCEIYEKLNDRSIDEGWMLSWFANALMRGFDEANWRRDAHIREFIGWLSADIPELHQVTVPDLADSYERFLRRTYEQPESGLRVDGTTGSPASE